MRSLFVLIILGLGFTSCKQSDPVSPDALTGVWVEKTFRKDTLIFNPSPTSTTRKEGYLTVNRGREANAGGYVVPKLGSGIYQYYKEERTLHVYNLLSSTYQFAGYTFEQVGSELRVGNFFELGFREPATATRTLVRL